MPMDWQTLCLLMEHFQKEHLEVEKEEMEVEVEVCQLVVQSLKEGQKVW